eukprot:PhM_4_TR11664/c2_g2_i1/m.64191
MSSKSFLVHSHSSAGAAAATAAADAVPPTAWTWRDMLGYAMEEQWPREARRALENSAMDGAQFLNLDIALFGHVHVLSTSTIEFLTGEQLKFRQQCPTTRRRSSSTSLPAEPNVYIAAGGHLDKPIASTPKKDSFIPSRGVMPRPSPLKLTSTTLSRGAPPPPQSRPKMPGPVMHPVVEAIDGSRASSIDSSKFGECTDTDGDTVDKAVEQQQPHPTVDNDASSAQPPFAGSPGGDIYEFDTSNGDASHVDPNAAVPVFVMDLQLQGRSAAAPQQASPSQGIQQRVAARNPTNVPSELSTFVMHDDDPSHHDDDADQHQQHQHLTADQTQPRPPSRASSSLTPNYHKNNTSNTNGHHHVLNSDVPSESGSAPPSARGTAVSSSRRIDLAAERIVRSDDTQNLLHFEQRDDDVEDTVVVSHATFPRGTRIAAPIPSVSPDADQQQQQQQPSIECLRHKVPGRSSTDDSSTSSASEAQPRPPPQADPSSNNLLPMILEMQRSMQAQQDMQFEMLRRMQQTQEDHIAQQRHVIDELTRTVASLVGLLQGQGPPAAAASLNRRAATTPPADVSPEHPPTSATNVWNPRTNRRSVSSSSSSIPNLSATNINNNARQQHHNDVVHLASLTSSNSSSPKPQQLTSTSSSLQPPHVPYSTATTTTGNTSAGLTDKRK